MKRSRASNEDLQLIREALRGLEPGASHQAIFPPNPATIFAPSLHANAVDPQRSLVIGNRGMGKSFWSSVLTHEETRQAIAASYPRLRLNSITAVLGFHEDAGKDDGPAPSPAVLASLLTNGCEPEAIWRAVLFKSLRSKIDLKTPDSLIDIIAWNASKVEESEAALRQADQNFRKDGKTFLLVFDALDRVGRDWGIITPLTQGVLRLVLDMRGFRSTKAKVFMRTDQSKDDALFRFADASKIRADAVNLVWKREEVFGLLYKYLNSEPLVRSALHKLMGEDDSVRTIESIQNDVAMQEQLFYRLAGEFMGAGPKRGRTYTWLYDHLADTFGETSPRSFITAIQRAAYFRPVPKTTVIDYSGIRAGVQDASEVRVRQLKEDYDWIDAALKPLAGLEVPCEPSIFLRRWKDRKTIDEIRTAATSQPRLLPLEIQESRRDTESELLQAMTNIGVVEFRTENRINVPDIFRVAAGIKRRGGVRPPSPKQ